MPFTKERINYLLEAYTSKTASAKEEAELMQWILASEDLPELKDFMQDEWEKKNVEGDFSNVNWDKIYSRIMQYPMDTPILRSIKVRRWRRLSVAAAILLICASAGYFYYKSGSSQPLALTPISIQDIEAPSSNQAVLTLADGTKIAIDSTVNGTLALQGDVRIIKKANGEINYAGSAAAAIGENTLQVLKGSKPLRLKLSDGTMVWLNVGSSLSYPATFMGPERHVKIHGEAYFEVAHDSQKPFVVTHDDLKIHVLGTHFNVNTYEDEAVEAITLLEGSVRVQKKQLTQILNPGQQAQIGRNIKVLNRVSMEEVMAWKEGKFRFTEKTDIGTIMRQIARWYDVDVEYKGTVKQQFWGSISKDVKISQVLNILEATGGIKFKIEGRKVIVMPP